MPAQLQYRRDTAANWTASNPLLFLGELGYETDTGKFKIGLQNLSWNSLPYYNSNASTFTYSNSIFYATSTGSFTLPASLQKPNAKWKVTLIGGGGAGGGTPATAGHVGNGGGSGGVVIGIYTYVSGVNTMSYTIGAGGTAGAANAAGNAGGPSTCTYNAVVYTAGGGLGGANSATVNGGGAGGAASGGTVNLVGFKGDTGGINTATMSYVGKGANTFLGFGVGGLKQGATGNGLAASGFGAGGSGGTNSATATARAGGVGAAGLIQIQY
jgi:hypothetical protein